MSAQPNTPQARRKWVVPSRSGDGATTFELFFDLVLGRALFPHLFPDNGEPLNHTRYLFLDDRSREFYIDWERSARGVVSACASPPGTTPPTAHSWPSSASSPPAAPSSAPGGQDTR